MAKEKACSHCRMIYSGDRCPNCNETVSTNAFKGRIHIFNPDDSEIAKNMKIKEKGEFAIKTK